MVYLNASIQDRHDLMAVPYLSLIGQKKYQHILGRCCTPASQHILALVKRKTNKYWVDVVHLLPNIS